MAKPKLPKIDIRLSELEEVSNRAEEYGDIVNVVVDNVIEKATGALDSLLSEIGQAMAGGEPMPLSDLDYYIAYLPTIMYFVADRAEVVGIKMDASSAIRKEKYDNLYILAAGKTIPDKESETRKLVMNEAVIENAYKRAYKKVQSKLEMADKVLASLKRVHTARLTDIEMGSHNTKGILIHAKNRRKDD